MADLIDPDLAAIRTASPPPQELDLREAYPASREMFPAIAAPGIDPEAQSLWPSSPDLWRRASPLSPLVARVAVPAPPPSPGPAGTSAPSLGAGGPDALLAEMYPVSPQMRDGEAPPQSQPDGEGTPQQSAGDAVVPPGFDPQLYGEFRAVSTAANLSPESAKAILDLHAKAVHASQVAHVEHVTKLAEAARADPELSGAWDANIKLANQVLVRYGTNPDLIAALQSSGLGNHPALIKLLVKIGQDLNL